MRITKKIFNDLAIIMIGLGIIIGLVFPLFSLLLGVPKEIALTLNYFLACILAGIILGVINITTARYIIGVPIKLLSHKMRHVEEILINKKNGIGNEICSPEHCFIQVNSEDELGKSTDAFNKLVTALSEVLETNAELSVFTEMLTSHLELDTLSKESLAQLIKNTDANGGAILIEKHGELSVDAFTGIKDPKSLQTNERILRTFKTHERQIIEFPDEIIIDGIVVDFHPKSLLIEPIVYKSVLLGVLVLVSSSIFPSNAIEKLSLFSQSLSLAFRNAITHDQMQTLAAVDSLTGLYNRRFGSKRLQEEYGRAIRSNTPISLLMFDIDHFKNVNDTYGHLNGDRVLVNVAKIATTAIREGDVLLRYGGEEFLCVLPGANQKDAMLVAERIRIMVMDSSLKHAEQEIKVTVSLGTATFPNPNIASCEQFVKYADEAMYTAKETGRNRIVSI
jgi:diguanylate cyclase (GGDEF)-like protein